MTPYIPTPNNYYGLAAFIGLVPGHFAVAERLWAYLGKRYSALVVHIGVKVMVIVVALLSIEKSYIKYLLFQNLLLKVILGIFIGYFCFLLEIKIIRRFVSNVNNKALEAIYHANKKYSIAIFLAINAILEELIFRKYLNDFICVFENNLSVFYMLMISSIIIFGLIHVSFGIEKCFSKAIFAIILTATVLVFHDIITTIIAHVVFNVMGFVLGETTQLRHSNA